MEGYLIGQFRDIRDDPSITSESTQRERKPETRRKEKI